MKIRTILYLVTLLPVFCYADCSVEAEAANHFMNDYKSYMDSTMTGKTEVSTLQWLQKNTAVSESFKNAYAKLEAEANKNDPELGLDFDPLLNAQDYPDQGFAVLSCDKKAQFVTLKGKGKDWDSFKVVVKVVNKSIIDGAGVINIPKNKQAVH